MNYTDVRFDMFYCNLVHNNIWPNWEKNADKNCIFRTLHDKYLRVVFCELIQDMVHSAALWFIQQSHHLTYPHDKHPTWNLFTLMKKIFQTKWMKFAIPNHFLFLERKNPYFKSLLLHPFVEKNFTILCDLTSTGLAFTLSTKVEQISGYMSTSWSNRGNLCLASMESSFMAFNKQTIIVSGKFFWLSLLRVKVSKSIKFWNEYMNKICVYIQKKSWWEKCLKFKYKPNWIFTGILIRIL